MHMHMYMCMHMHMHMHNYVYSGHNPLHLYTQAELAGLFKDNFAKYATACTAEVVACGPKA